MSDVIRERLKVLPQTDTKHVFVYGRLRLDCAAYYDKCFNIHDVKGVMQNRGSVVGFLYELNGRPYVVPDERGSEVKGFLLSASSEKEILEKLTLPEIFPAGDLEIVRTEVKLKNSRTPAYIFVPKTHIRAQLHNLVESGDWKVWLNERTSLPNREAHLSSGPMLLEIGHTLTEKDCLVFVRGAEIAKWLSEVRFMRVDLSTNHIIQETLHHYPFESHLSLLTKTDVTVKLVFRPPFNTNDLDFVLVVDPSCAPFSFQHLYWVTCLPQENVARAADSTDLGPSDKFGPLVDRYVKEVGAVGEHSNGTGPLSPYPGNSHSSDDLSPDMHLGASAVSNASTLYEQGSNAPLSTGSSHLVRSSPVQSDVLSRSRSGSSLAEGDVHAQRVSVAPGSDLNAEGQLPTPQVAGVSPPLQPHGSRIGVHLHSQVSPESAHAQAVHSEYHDQLPLPHPQQYQQQYVVSPGHGFSPAAQPVLGGLAHATSAKTVVSPHTTSPQSSTTSGSAMDGNILAGIQPSGLPTVPMVNPHGHQMTPFLADGTPVERNLVVIPGTMGVPLENGAAVQDPSVSPGATGGWDEHSLHTAQAAAGAPQLACHSAPQPSTAFPQPAAPLSADPPMTVPVPQLAHIPPRHISQWTAEDVTNWLRSLRLGDYADRFLHSLIEGDALMSVTDEELSQHLQIDNYFHRKRIISARDKLLQGPVVQSAPAAGQQAETPESEMFSPDISTGSTAGSSVASAASSVVAGPPLGNTGVVTDAAPRRRSPLAPQHPVVMPRIPVQSSLSQVVESPAGSTTHTPSTVSPEVDGPVHSLESQLPPSQQLHPSPTNVHSQSQPQLQLHAQPPLPLSQQTTLAQPQLQLTQHALPMQPQQPQQLQPHQPQQGQLSQLTLPLQLQAQQAPLLDLQQPHPIPLLPSQQLLQPQPAQQPPQPQELQQPQPPQQPQQPQQPQPPQQTQLPQQSGLQSQPAHQPISNLQQQQAIQPHLTTPLQPEPAASQLFHNQQPQEPPQQTPPQLEPSQQSPLQPEEPLREKMPPPVQVQVQAAQLLATPQQEATQPHPHPQPHAASAQVPHMEVPMPVPPRSTGHKAPDYDASSPPQEVEVAIADAAESVPADAATSETMTATTAGTVDSHNIAEAGAAHSEPAPHATADRSARGESAAALPPTMESTNVVTGTAGANNIEDGIQNAKPTESVASNPGGATSANSANGSVASAKSLENGTNDAGGDNGVKAETRKAKSPESDAKYSNNTNNTSGASDVGSVGSSVRGTKSAGVDRVDSFAIPYEALKIGERIGMGAYGEVMKGEWRSTPVAVKRFLDTTLSDELIKEFFRETSMLQQLRHPNILLYLGAVIKKPNLCIVTEYMDRGSLFRLLHRSVKPVPRNLQHRIAYEVAQGMNFLHTNNPTIVHRDLKSPNILINRMWNIKIADFGLSRVKQSQYMTAGCMGTPEWMAPEVLRNERANEKCDLYSYGVVLWELVTKQQPWKGIHSMQVVGEVGYKEGRLTIPDDCEPVFRELMLACWREAFDTRPSFEEVIHMLEQAAPKDNY